MSINNLSLQDKKNLLAQKDAYAVAQASGNKEAMAMANKAANDLRSKVGIANSNTGILTSDQLRTMIASEEYASSQLEQANRLMADQASAKNAIDSYIAQQKAAQDAAYNSTVAGIDMAAQSSISEQNKLLPQADKEYQAQLGAINQQQYSDMERSKVVGQNRGILSSQQQLGVEAGIANQANRNVSAAAQTRVERIQTINDRIAQIKQQADLQKVQAAANRDLGVAQSSADASLKLMDRNFQLQDQTRSENFAIEQVKKQHEQEVYMSKLTNEQRLGIMNLEQKFTKEMANVDLANKLILAEFDQDFQERILKTNQSFQEKMFKMESGERRAIAGMEIAARAALFNAETARQEKFFKLDQTAKYSFTQFETEQQIALMKAESNLKDKDSFAKDIVVTEMANQGFFNLYSNPEAVKEQIWSQPAVGFKQWFDKALVNHPGLAYSFNKDYANKINNIKNNITESELNKLKQEAVNGFNDLYKTMNNLSEQGVIPGFGE